MQIRVLTPDDAEQFRSVRLNALKNAPQAFSSSYEEEILNPVENFRQRLLDQHNTVFGGFDDMLLMGMVGLRREEKIKLRHKAWIWGVYVEPQARGTGLARGLMVAALEKARQMPALSHIYLTVLAINEPARSLYLSLGFEIYGYEKRALFVNGEYYDEELMMLEMNT